MAKPGTKSKPRPKAKKTDKEQSERFKETARKLGVDETGKDFEQAFRKLVLPRVKSRQNSD